MTIIIIIIIIFESIFLIFFLPSVKIWSKLYSEIPRHAMTRYESEDNSSRLRSEEDLLATLWRSLSVSKFIAKLQQNVFYTSGSSRGDVQDNNRDNIRVKSWYIH